MSCYHLMNSGNTYNQGTDILDLVRTFVSLLNARSRLVSLFDMKRFYSHSFLEISRYFEAVAVLTKHQDSRQSEKVIPDAIKMKLKAQLDTMREACIEA